MGTAQEQSGYFSGGHGQLYGMFHAAAGTPRAGLLVLPPYGEERKCALRQLVLTARALAAAGIAVLRFDYRGTGDSLGDLAGATLDDWVQDAVAARRALAELAGTSRLFVLGARLGGNLALRPELGEAERVILWEPLLAGKEFLTEMTRRRQLKRLGTTAAPGAGAKPEEVWAGGGVVDFDGFPVSAGFAAGLAELELGGALAGARGRVLALHVSGAKALPATWAKLAQDLAARPGSACRLLRDRPFWGRLDYYEAKELIGETVAFCIAD